MAPVSGRPTAPGVPDDARSPDQMEAEALAEVRGLEQTMRARVEAAFPDKTDPIRIYGEGLAAAGVAQVRSMSKLAGAMVARIGGLLTTAQQTAQAQTEAATAQAEADRAAAKLEAVAVIRAGFGEVLAVDRRARYGWAVGIAGLGVALVFGVGLLTGVWWARASATADAADKLAALEMAAVKTTVGFMSEEARLRETADGMRKAVADAGTGLSVLRTMGTLPEGERAAMDGIVDELAGAAKGTKPSPQLQAVRGLMALPAPAREQAMAFARIGDAHFRDTFLPIVRLAEERSRGTWWPGEEVYPGCITIGPALAIKGGGKIPTCLVQLPDSWLSVPDTYLRTNHYKLSAW